MKRRVFFSFFAVVVLVAVLFGARYFNDSWAPTSFEGGLQFSETPELLDSRGEVLADDVVREFVQICSKLRSTTRDIGEDQGDSVVRMRYPIAKNSDFLTVYRSRGVVFHGWWIDAKTYSMMDRRAPCFELTTELTQFLAKHKLNTINADE